MENFIFSISLSLLILNKNESLSILDRELIYEGEEILIRLNLFSSTKSFGAENVATRQ